MFDRPNIPVKASRIRSCYAAQCVRLTKGVRELLVEGKLSEGELEMLLSEESIHSERLLATLEGRIEKTLGRLVAEGKLSEENAMNCRESVRSIAFERLEEEASPMHRVLSDKPIYCDSDPPTRRLLRCRIHRFARRHRLSDEQAASLWEGELGAPSLGLKLIRRGLLWLPLLLAAFSCTLLLPLIGRELSWGALIVIASLFCPIWEGFSLLSESAVRYLLPSSPEPALRKDASPAVCAMLVAPIDDDADAAMRRLEMLIAANKDADALFGLILTLPDAPSEQTVEDEKAIARYLSAFEALEEKCDRPLRLAVAARSYCPREHYWRGKPTYDELLTACQALLSGNGDHFRLTLGGRSPEKAPEALYLAPADGILAPDGLRALSAALFHPLTAADAILPIRRSIEGRQKDTIDSYTKRQVTLKKLGCTLPFADAGMLKLSALKGKRAGELSCTLGRCSLFTDRTAQSFGGQNKPETLILSSFPTFRARSAAFLRLPLLLMLMGTTPVLFGYGLLLMSADLLVQVALSIGLGQRFVTHTLPVGRDALGQALKRLIYAVGLCFDAIPFIDRLPLKARAHLRTLSAILVGIATAALAPFPFALIGLVWAASPLFTLHRTADRRHTLSAADRTDLLAWTRKSWRFFERNVTAEHPLPPVGFSLSQSQSASITTPVAFAYYLIACLAACDLSFIDPFTLERRVKGSLDAWERLPTYKGLPYARYSLETGDSFGRDAVETASCGRYALAMAVLSEGLLDYAAENPSLGTLSLRIEALWKKMDFSVLYDKEHDFFCEALLPNGERTGKLDLLMGDAQTACFAALALGQIDQRAWKKLRRPAAGRGLSLGMQSKWGTLDEYLSSALFLPASRGSLIGCARRYACRSIIGSDSRLPLLFSFTYSVAPDGSISDCPTPSGNQALSIAEQSDTPRQIAPHAAFLMLPHSPTLAMYALRQLEKAGALTAFGFCEAIERTRSDDLRIVRMGVSEHLGESMASLVNALDGGRFQRRLMRIPSFAMLSPLLNEPFDWLERSLPTQSIAPIPEVQTALPQPPTDIPLLTLLGDANWGLLMAEGRRMIPFYRGKALACPSSSHFLYEDGKFTGLLFFREGKPIAAPATVCRSEKGKLTFAYHDEDISLFTHLSFPEADVLELKLSADMLSSQITALFCYTPPSSGEAFRLDTLPACNLLLIHANGYVVAIAAEGLGNCFIRAEEAPLPLGESALSALVDRAGYFTEGTLLTPSCKLGGCLQSGEDARFLLAVGESKTEVLDKITRIRQGRSALQSTQDALLPLPLSLPGLEENTFSYAQMLQLRFLFEALKLRPITPSKAHSEPSEHLLRSLERSEGILRARGFERDDEPFYLPESDSPSTEERLKASLRSDKRQTLISTPLPPKTHIRISEDTLTVVKGRDLPPVRRCYSSCGIAFFADSFAPSLCFEGEKEEMPLVLTIEQTKDEARSLFYDAREVCYGESEVRYIGEGYEIAASLSAEQNLLILEVSSSLPVSLRFGGRVPSRQTEEASFWHRRGCDGKIIDFCSRIIARGKTVFLLGSFERADDRRYYLLREQFTTRLANDQPLCSAEVPSAQLTWQSKAPYFVPLLLHPALASDSPKAFPILLFFRESRAFDALVRLFSTDDRLMQVISCLMYEQFTEDRDGLRQKVTHATPSGEVEESIYLASARALEAMLEADRSPLVAHLTAAFADLAGRMGDYAGEKLYRERRFEPAFGDAEYAHQANPLAAIACRLLNGDPSGVRMWKKQCDAIGLFPVPEEAGALWALFWYGVLGYRESPRGFSLHPILSSAFEGGSFTLRRKDTLYRIRISLSDHSSVLLDGQIASEPFLFDKNEHFLEITVEKLPRIV